MSEGVEAYRIAEEISTERLFANNFLTVLYRQMVNVDYFTRDKRGNLNFIFIKLRIFHNKNSLICG